MRNSQPPSPFESPQTCRWTVYIDGSAKPNPGKMGIGGVMLAPDGTQSTFSLALPHQGCNNEAEAWAAIHALRHLLAQSAQAAVLYSDSSILVEQLAHPQPKAIARLDAIYRIARELAEQLPQLQVQWVPRHKNQQADALCRAQLLHSLP